MKKALTLSIYLLATLVSVCANAKSSVWKVSKGEDYFFIGGTVHLLNAQDHPLPEEFNFAYQQSDTLIFETDIDQGEKAQQKLLQAMLNDSRLLLSEQLEPKVYRALQDYLKSRNLPLDNFSPFKPWAISLMITMFEYQHMGMQPKYGVDHYFNQLADVDNKRVIWLESLDEQVHFLSSMERVDPNTMLSYTLEDLQSLPEFASFLKQSWRSGDIEAFTANPLIKEMKTEFPDVYHTLLSQRNNNWMPKLLALNNNQHIEFVLVGAMHLNDKDGLLMQLQRAGYRIDQLSLQ